MPRMWQRRCFDSNDLSCAPRVSNPKQQRQSRRPGRRPQPRGQAGRCAATRAVRYQGFGLSSEWFPWRGALARARVAAMSPGARLTIAPDRHPGLAPPGRLQYPRCPTPYPRARCIVAQDLAGHLRAFERSLASCRTHLWPGTSGQFAPRPWSDSRALWRRFRSPAAIGRLVSGTMWREGRKTESGEEDPQRGVAAPISS